MKTRGLAALCAVAATAAGLAACGSARAPAGTQSTSTTLPGAGRPPVTVGDRNTYPEEFVLGALYEQALAAQGFSVSLDRNIGPPEVRIQALESGSVDVYPEYVDVWDTTIAGYKRAFGSARAAYRAGQSYATKHALKLLKPTPFADTDALGVTVNYASTKGLSTLYDLRKVASQLTIGGPPQFQADSPGLAAVEAAYAFLPAAFKTLPVGDQYPALDQGTVQAADVGTTDGQLLSGNYVVLRDPAHVFGWGNVVPVVSVKALQQEGPAFVKTINAVSALLTQQVMRQLNADVAVSHEDPAAVAKQFLIAHHLMSASSGS